MLVLPIKKQWFDMILSGEKKEEYREYKEYYTTRFSKVFDMCDGFPVTDEVRELKFRNGYHTDSPSFVAECRLRVDEGRTEWGAEAGVVYYVLEIVNIKDIRG